MVFPTDPAMIKMELALGVDITGDTDLWTWTDISEYVRTADGAKVVVRRGRRNDSGSVSPATASFDLDNTDGRFCTQYPLSPYYPLLQVNTPVRISISTNSGLDWSERYSGYMAKLPTSWRGPAGSDSWVSVTAESVLRRLGKQGAHSALYWTAPHLPSGNTGCVEYWPMEDGKAATECTSFFPGGLPMTVAGSIELGASTPPPGSEATAQSDYEFMKANPPSATGIVRPYTDTGAWTLVGMFKTDEESAVDTVLLDADISHGEGSTNPDQVRLLLKSDRLNLEVYQEDGTLLGSVSTGALTIEPGDGQWHAFAVRAGQSGSDVAVRLRYHGTSYDLTLTGKTLGTVRKVAFPSTQMTTEPELLAVGHLAVYDDDLQVQYMDRYANAMNAYLDGTGEAVNTRLIRLDSESGLMSTILASTAETAMYEQLGEQPKSSILGVIEDAVEADGGIIFEPKNFASGSLRYRSRSFINANTLNPPALTLTQNDFSIIEQADDDHYLVTQATVSGAGSTMTASDSAVENEISVSRNIFSPDRLADHAGWVLYQGTRRDYRYPRILMHLHSATNQFTEWKSAELGDRILITDPPPGVVNDIDLILEGYQESMAQFSWTVEMYCSPASRYRIARLDDTEFGRMDTAASRLVNALTSSATAFDVETEEGPEWTASNGLTLAGVVGDYVTTPDAAAFRITGDLVLRADVTPASWNNGTNQDFVARWDDQPAGNGSYLLGLADGRIRLVWSVDGTATQVRTSSIDIPSAAGTRLAVAAFLDVDNGAAGHTARFYTAPTKAGPWTEFGTADTRAGVTSIFAGTAAVEAGTLSEGAVARTDVVIHGVEIATSLTATPVLDTDFTQATRDSSTFTDAGGLVWTRHAGAQFQENLGFGVGIGGERMTALGIVPSFSDLFTRTVASGWGTSTSGHAWSNTGGTASDYSVNATRGIISIGAVNSFRGTYISSLPVANIDRTMTVRIPVLATGAGILVRQTARWDTAVNSYYALGLQAETDQTVTATLVKVIAGSVTTLTTRVTGLTHGTTTDFRMRFKTDGPWLFGKIWSDAGSEPPQWTVAAYDTDLTAAGVWGVRPRLNSGNTNVLPVLLQFDRDATLHPQRFTVTRAVNSVTKAHSAGAPVGLFQPNHLGL